MNAKIAQAMNEQVVFDFNAASLYLAMSLEMEKQKYSGFAKWLNLQYQEEMTHAGKFVKYLQDRDEVVTLGDIKAQAVTFDSPLACAKAVQAHEELITSKIHALYALALEEKDYASSEFLSFFVKEQVEEEANARDLVDQFTFAGDNKPAQMFVDAKLGGRQQ